MVSPQQSITAQNDIADLLYGVAKMFYNLGLTSIADFLTEVGDWFERLTDDERQCLQAQFGDVPGCTADVIDALKGDLIAAGTLLLTSVPERLRDYLNCLLGQATQPSAQTLVNRQAALSCILAAAWNWWRTRDVPGSLTMLITCLVSSGNGDDVPPPPGPGQSPFRSVKRCGG